MEGSGVAVTLKEEGNKLFKAGKFREAGEKYTEALLHDPLNSVLYSNRSLTSIKQGDYDQALSDAQESVRLNPGWPKGFLRKAMALEGLGRHNEVMQSAAEGFRVCGEGRIKRELVSLWLKANQAQNRLPPGCIELPRGILITSQEYLYVLARLMQSLSGESPLGFSQAVQCLHSCAVQMEEVLQSFGESTSPVMRNWAKNLPHEIYPHDAVDSAKRVQLEKDMELGSEEFVSFLNRDVDPTLYPLLRPIVGLAVLIVLNRTNILTECNTGHLSAELMNRALLPLFESSILSTDDYHSMYVGRICSILDSFVGRGYELSAEERATVERYCKKAEKAIKNYPQGLPEREKDVQLTERALSNVRQNVLMPVSLSPPKVLVTSSLSVEVAEQIVKEKPQEVKAYIVKHLQELESAKFLTMGEVEELLTMTGIFLDLGEEASALKVFTKGEQAFFQVLGHMLSGNTLTLDHCPANIAVIRQLVLNMALRLQQPVLFADVILRWKCLFKEFRKNLIQSSQTDIFWSFFEWHTKQSLSSKQCDAEEIRESLHQQMLKEEQLLRTSASSVLADMAKMTYSLLQKHLPDGVVAVDYIFFPPLRGNRLQEAYCVVCERDAVPVVCELEYRAIRNQAALVTKLMLDTSELSETAIRKFKGRIESDLALLAQVIFPDCLVKLVTSEKVRHIYISPDSDLVGVPIDMLPVSHSSSPLKPFYEHVTVSLLPSMRGLLLYDTVTKWIPNQVCSIIGNPNFDLQQSSPNLSALDKLVTYFCEYFSISSPTGPILDQLDESQDEVDFISLQLKSRGLPVQAFVGDEATLSNVLSVQNPLLLHLSSHAHSGPRTSSAYRGNFFDDLSSGIALAGFNTFSRGQYDKIRPEYGTAQLPPLAIFSMKLRGTKLVFLSTCNSAVGTAARQEAVDSLAEAFLVAGVETVVATLWPVRDQPATEFSKFFYEKLTTLSDDGVRPSEALAYAKQHFQRLGLWPCHGAFMCYGLDRPLKFS